MADVRFSDAMSTTANEDITTNSLHTPEIGQGWILQQESVPSINDPVQVVTANNAKQVIASNRAFYARHTAGTPLDGADYKVRCRYRLSPVSISDQEYIGAGCRFRDGSSGNKKYGYAGTVYADTALSPDGYSVGIFKWNDTNPNSASILANTEKDSYGGGFFWIEMKCWTNADGNAELEFRTADTEAELDDASSITLTHTDSSSPITQKGEGAIVGRMVDTGGQMRWDDFTVEQIEGPSTFVRNRLDHVARMPRTIRARHTRPRFIHRVWR